LKNYFNFPFLTTISDCRRRAVQVHGQGRYSTRGAHIIQSIAAQDSRLLQSHYENFISFDERRWAQH